MHDLFAYAGYDCNPDLSKWDTGNVVLMKNMFECFPAFNADISRWNVGRVGSMQKAFAYDCPERDNTTEQRVDYGWDGATFLSAFNADISRWEVARVVTFRDMFRNARSFNADLSTWNVGRVQNMKGMFHHAYSFNADLSKWTTSEMTDAEGMFAGATSFNADISRWDVSRVRIWTVCSPLVRTTKLITSRGSGSLKPTLSTPIYRSGTRRARQA